MEIAVFSRDGEAITCVDLDARYVKDWVRGDQFSVMWMSLEDGFDPRLSGRTFYFTVTDAYMSLQDKRIKCLLVEGTDAELLKEWGHVMRYLNHPKNQYALEALEQVERELHHAVVGHAVERAMRHTHETEDL